MSLLMLGSKKTVASILDKLFFLFPLTCFEASSLLWAASWWGSCAQDVRDVWQQPVRNWGPLSNNSQELNPAKDHICECGSGSYPSWTFSWDHRPNLYLDFSFVRELEPEAPAKSSLDSWFKGAEIIKICCFMLLNLGVIFRAAIYH